MEAVKMSAEEAIVELNESKDGENSPSLDLLNDDCLLQIFKYIDTAKDLIAIEKVCERWQRISAMTLKHVDIEGEDADYHLEEILNKHGNDVTSLQIYSNNDFEEKGDVFKMINLHCKKLLRLNICLERFFVSSKLNVKKYPFLKYLERLEIYEFGISFDDDQNRLLKYIIIFLKSCRNLDTLLVHVSNGTCFTMRNKGEKVEVKYLQLFVRSIADQLFSLFPDLVDLKVIFDTVNEYDEEFNFYDYLVNIANRVTSIEFKKNAHDSCFKGVSYKWLKLSNLKKLVIEESPCVTDDVIYTFVRICPALEILDLYKNENITDFGYKFLGNSKVLKKLSLRDCDVMNDTLLFLAENVKTLEEIHLPYGPPLSDAELINFVELLPNLRFMRLIGFEEFLEDDFKVIKQKVIEKNANKCLELEFIDGRAEDAEIINLKKGKDFSVEPADALTVTLISSDEDDLKIFNDRESRYHFYDDKFPHTRKGNAKFYRYFTVEE